MISGKTKVIAHIGFPTEAFKAPLIYNPYFEKHQIDVVVVPFGCRPDEFESFLRTFFKLSNALGALITMPHKVSVVELLDGVSTTVAVAGSCNAVRVDDNGGLVGDMFDGEGFVRGVKRKGFEPMGRRALVVGCGGVGSAIAASLAKENISELMLFDPSDPAMSSLAGRLSANYPDLHVNSGLKDPAGFDLVVNATPLGMLPEDPLPFDVQRLDKSTFVGEVVMKQEITPLLAAAQALGCSTQVGTDMLFEQIPAYLEFFGLRSASPEELRSVAHISY